MTDISMSTPIVASKAVNPAVVSRAVHQLFSFASDSTQKGTSSFPRTMPGSDQEAKVTAALKAQMR